MQWPRDGWETAVQRVRARTAAAGVAQERALSPQPLSRLAPGSATGRSCAHAGLRRCAACAQQVSHCTLLRCSMYSARGLVVRATNQLSPVRL